MVSITNIKGMRLVLQLSNGAALGVRLQGRRIRYGMGRTTNSVLEKDAYSSGRMKHIKFKG